MSKPLTHQDRARKAAEALGPHPNSTAYGEPEACQVAREEKAELIARETFPEELLEAINALLGEVELKRKMQGSEGHFGEAAEQARTALALYEEEAGRE